MTDRKQILETAIKCVCGDRDQQYGSPLVNFGIIAEYWNVYLSSRYDVLPGTIQASDVANMMALFKLGRITSAPSAKEDSFVDLAGYAACAGEITCAENTTDNVIKGA